jgi:hypothetical protein
VEEVWKILTRFKTIVLGMTTEATKHERSDLGKYIKFDGTVSEWKGFYSKTKAYGGKKGWYDTMLTAATSDESDESKQLRKDAKYFLTMACDGKSAIYVEATEDPFEAWKSIIKRYEDVDADDLTSLHRLLNSTIEEGPGHEDPEVWFLNIEQKQKEIVKASGT